MPLITRRWFYWLVAAMFLHGCGSIGTRKTGPGNEQLYLDRASRLESVQHWGLVGRLSLDDGDQGGSGKLRWDVWPAGSDLDFHGAMGRGAWQLQVRDGGATLMTSDGNVQTASAVEDLVQLQLGWSLPVENLEWWVRGLRAPGAADAVQYDSDGLLLNLQQSGWSVEFKRYRDFDGTVFPVRLEAQRGSYRVKLAIGNWRLGLEKGG